MKELLIKLNVLMAQSDQAECSIEADKILINFLENIKELCDSNIEESKKEGNEREALMFMFLKERCLSTIIDRNLQLQAGLDKHIKILEKAKEVKLELDSVQQQEGVVH